MNNAQPGLIRNKLDRIGKGDPIETNIPGLLSRERSLRAVLGSFATGVTVLTCRLSDGRRHGVTANSFTSVSLDPPLVLVCLSRTGRSGRAIVEAGVFAINVLHTGQRAAADDFSTVTKNRPVEEWSRTETGVPILRKSLATIECAVRDVIEVGDHDVIIGSIRSTEMADSALGPLVYYRGQYRTFSNVE